MGLRRMKEKTLTWRLMQRYEAMKKSKGSGKSIIATARKMATIIWNMLTEDIEFDTRLMVDRRLAKKSESMSGTLLMVKKDMTDPQEKPVEKTDKKKGEVVRINVHKTGVASKKRKKMAKR